MARGVTYLSSSFSVEGAEAKAGVNGGLKRGSAGDLK